MVEIFIFIFGLIVGSFLNSVVYRLENGQSFIKGRSYCPNCEHSLNWLDLVPVFSFLILRGRCRYCREKISFQYPLIETITGVLFLLIFKFYLSGFGKFSDFFFQSQFLFYLVQFLSLIFLFIIFSLLIVIFVYDLKHYLIPDQIVYLGIIVSFFYDLRYFLFNQSDNFKSAIFSALGASLFFLFIVLISKEKWMGAGDVKLAFLMGLLLGFPNILPALFLSFFIGAIIGLGLVFFHKKKLKSEIPFGPFLIIGTFLSFFWGEAIIDWYISFLI